MHNMELFVTCVDLSIIWFYPADNVSESSFQPWWLVKPFILDLEQRALRSPVANEYSGSSSFILLKSIPKLVQTYLNSSWFWLGER